MNSKIGLIGLVCALFPLTSAVAQKGAFNPYSQLGIGLPAFNPVVPLASMGGGYNAIAGTSYINYLNPASYSSYDHVLFQFGMETQSLTATRNGNERKANLAFFNQLALGLPIIKNRLGMSFGYTPYTDVGYTFNSSERLINNPDTVNVNYEYEGKGGVDRFHLGFGGNPVKGWSIGFNTYFYLGNIDKVKTSYFPSGFGSSNIQSVTNTRIADFGFDFGTQYAINFKDKELKDKYRLTFGATYTLGKKMAARNTAVARYFTGTLADQFYQQDTIAARQKVKLQFPHAFGAGVSFGQPDYWQINADFNSTLWSGFRYPNGSSEPLFGNSYRVTLGGEIRPGGKAQKNIFNRMTYRAGGRYGESFLRPGGNAFKEIGVSVGLGIPIIYNDLMDKKLASSINIGLEYGLSVPGSTNYTREQMIRFVLAFNIKTKWFRTYKFN